MKWRAYTKLKPPSSRFGVPASSTPHGGRNREKIEGEREKGRESLEEKALGCILVFRVESLLLSRPGKRCSRLFSSRVFSLSQSLSPSFTSWITFSPFLSLSLLVLSSFQSFLNFTPSSPPPPPHWLSLSPFSFYFLGLCLSLLPFDGELKSRVIVAGTREGRGSEEREKRRREDKER